jgi:hypothetical protein
MPQQFAALDLTGAERRAILERLLDVITADSALSEIRKDAQYNDTEASRIEALPPAERVYYASACVALLIDRAVVSARTALIGLRAIAQGLSAEGIGSAYTARRLEMARENIAAMEDIMHRRSPDTADLVAAAGDREPVCV